LGRDRYLAEAGFRVVRFANADVMRDVGGVVEAVRLEVASLRDLRQAPPDPSRKREGDYVLPVPNSSRSGEDRQWLGTMARPGGTERGSVDDFGAGVRAEGGEAVAPGLEGF